MDKNIESRREIPAWMLDAGTYEPEADRDGFITKSVLKMMSLLGAIRDNTFAESGIASPVMKLICTLLFIILSATSRNMFFTYILYAGFLVRVMLLPGKSVKRVMSGAAGVAVLSIFILLPAVFMGSPRSMLTVSLKVFLSVGLINLMAVTTPWNRITEALKVFRVPDMFIFIFDLTLKYIAILGDLCFDILTALQMRSVGKNKHKGEAFSGVVGVAFLKSREMAEEMYGAMTCRGFEGEYHKRYRNPFRKTDLLCFVQIAFVVAAFIYFR